MKMIKFFALLLLLAVFLPLSAQKNSYTSTQDSDPEAKAMLDGIRKKYDAYKTLTADFRLEMALPNQPLEVQQGKVSRKGDLVRFKLGNQEGIMTSDASYFILHGSKEVQINDLPDPDEITGMLSPQNIFNFYEGDNYIVALQGEETVEGRKLQVIELKPVERNGSDFTKLRLLVDRSRKEITSVRAFARDGSNYTFVLGETKGDVALNGKTFVFDQAEFPGYHVEDLRF